MIVSSKERNIPRKERKKNKLLQNRDTSFQDIVQSLDCSENFIPFTILLTVLLDNFDLKKILGLRLTQDILILQQTQVSDRIS